MKDHQTRESPSHTTAHAQAVTIAAAGADKETAPNWGGMRLKKTKTKQKVCMHAHIYLWDLPSPYLFIYFSLAFYAKTRDESLLNWTRSRFAVYFTRLCSR